MVTVSHAQNFTHTKAFQKLKELAENPLDLTQPGVLTKERIRDFCAVGSGFKLLYATERVTYESMNALRELADEMEVVKQMHQMQSGEIMNFIEGYPSEKRSVLHTALRDFFNDKKEASVAREAAKRAEKETEKLRQFLNGIDKSNRFTDLVVIAIGGSELGPKANYLALSDKWLEHRRAHFIGNVDPDDVSHTLKNLDLNKVLVVVISKTGTTLETVTNEALARDVFSRAGLDPNQHFIAVTAEGSAMDKPNGYLARFYMWDWVGGRFSAASVSGGLVIGFTCGFDAYWEFLRGAHSMDLTALKSNIRDNVPLLAALLSVWNRNFLGIESCAIVPYSQALWRYSAHVQQVEMESNGKHIDRQGNKLTFDTSPIFWGEVGTNAQHSFYQMIHQGTTPIALELIGFKESQWSYDLSVNGTTSQQKLLANLLAQAMALAAGRSNDNPNKNFEGNRPSHLLIAQKLTPFALGALFAFYEHKAAFQGFLWNINSFDQEGVQLGKELANKILDCMKEGSKNSYPEAEAFLGLFEKF